MAIEVVAVQSGPTARSLEELVDADLDEFEKYFMSLGNDGLAGPERAVIKTYLWWKTHQENDDGEKTGS